MINRACVYNDQGNKKAFFLSNERLFGIYWEITRDDVSFYTPVCWPG